MTNSVKGLPCPEDQVNAVLAAFGRDKPAGRSALEALLGAYPTDPRLYFLKGSWLAAQGDYAAARLAMRQAVDLAPDYAIARFQLGLLELSSNKALAAQETWGPLHVLPRGHPLRSFVTGFEHLIRDEYAEAIAYLEEGIARNHDNAPLNADMQLVISKITELMSGRKTGIEAISPVDFLLQQAAFKIRH